MSANLEELLFGDLSETVLDFSESTRSISYCMAKDGIWERRNSQIGSVVYLKESLSMPFVTKQLQESFTWSMPKIPGGILNATATFFKSIMGKMDNSECMVQIFFDSEDQKYFIYIPEQYVSGVTINFYHNKEYQLNSRYIWVADIHSHNTLQAKFSKNDDRDERSTRIYGILGQLDKDPYQSRWRIGCNGKYIFLTTEEVFDTVSDEVFEIPEEQFKNVQFLESASDEVLTSFGIEPDNFRKRMAQKKMEDEMAKNILANRGSGSIKLPLNFPTRDSNVNTSSFDQYSKMNSGFNGNNFSYHNSTPTNFNRVHQNSISRKFDEKRKEKDYTIIPFRVPSNLNKKAYDILDTFLADLSSYFIEGPIDIYKDTSNIYYGVDVLGSILSLVLKQLNDDLRFEFGKDSDGFEADLTDVSVDFINMLSYFDDFPDCVSAMASEIKNYANM